MGGPMLPGRQHRLNTWLRRHGREPGMLTATADAARSRRLALSAGMAAALLAYALLPHPALALAAAVAFTVLAYARPDLGLAAVLATLPTYYFPREFGGIAVSLPE